MALNLSNLADELKKLLGQAGGAINQGVQNFNKPLPTDLGRANSIKIASKITSTVGNIPQVKSFINTPIQRFVPNASPLAPTFTPSIKEYWSGQVTKPLDEANKLMSQPGIGNKALGAASLLGPAFALTPVGAAWNIGGGGIAGAARSLRTGQNMAQSIKQGIAEPTSLASQGLGVSNPVLALAGDIALMNPRGSIKSVGKVKNALTSIAKGAMHPEDMREAVGAIDRVLYGVGNDLKPTVVNAGKNQQKYVLTQLKKDEELIRGMAENYGIKMGKKANIKAVAQELYNRINVDSGRPQMNALVGKDTSLGVDSLKFTGPYKRGDVTQLENKLDELLNTTGFVNSPKWEARYAARNTARKELEYYAKEGVPEAQRQLAAVDTLQEQINMARETKNIPVVTSKTPGIATKPQTAPLPPQSKILPQGEIPKATIPSMQVYNAEATPKTLNNIKIRDLKAEQRTSRAEFAQWQKSVFQQEGATQTTGQAMNKVSGALKSGTKSPISDPTDLKDISGFKGQARDVYRNFKEAFGSKFNEAKRVILDPFDAAKGKFIDEQNKLTGEVDTVIQKGLGIKKGSAESAAVQEFGEKQRDFNSLVKEFGEDKANKIIEADKWFRGMYDKLRAEVNQTRAQIYPGQADKQIPYRADYYRHFRELAEGVAGLKNIFETPSGISSKLAGISYQTNPKSKFLSIAQRRLGMQTDVDAVAGFLDYIKASTYAKNIDPQTAKFRAYADELAQATAEGPNAGKLNNFITFLNRYADDLAGKTNAADRFIQETVPGGRTTMRALNWINSRVKANVILGNLSSSVAQAGNIPQGVASAGVTNVPKGIARTVAGIFSKNDPINKSGFIKERYFRGYDKFDTGIIQNTKKAAAWMTQVLDEVGTKFIWNMHYNKALGEGIENAAKYADDATRSLVAGRGVGEVPLIQKSKVFQLVAPFQLEVGNLWWVMKDMVDERQFGQIAKLFAASYLFNRVAEGIRGSDVVFDPIRAIEEGVQAFNEEDDKKVGVARFAGRIGGEIASNVPLGQNLATLYPEYGVDIGGQNVTRKELFGKGDPTRFGSGLLAGQAFSDPLYKLIPPFGGGQLKKTVEGLGAYSKGYSETDKGRIRYPIEQNASNLIKTAAFGQYNTPEARDYFDKKGTPLGEKQSAMFKTDKSVYNKVMDKREQDRAIDKAKASIKAQQGGSQEIGDRIVFWDDKTGEVKSISKAQQAYDETNAQYDYVSDQLKDAEDFKTWVDTSKKYVDYLKDYKKTLTAPDEKDDALRLQKKIETIEDSIAKYTEYGGFKKGKKPPKITIKATQIPEMKFTITRSKKRNLLLKPPKIKKQSNRRFTIK